SGLRGGVNAAAFAFAQGWKSRETGEHPAMGVLRGPVPSCAATTHIRQVKTIASPGMSAFRVNTSDSPTESHVVWSRATEARRTRSQTSSLGGSVSRWFVLLAVRLRT